jgi:hypothetical protein
VKNNGIVHALLLFIRCSPSDATKTRAVLYRNCYDWRNFGLERDNKRCRDGLNLMRPCLVAVPPIEVEVARYESVGAPRMAGSLVSGQVKR